MHLILIPVIYFFVFVAGISGNALFIGAVLKNKKLQSCVFILLANESLSDLIFVLLSLFLGTQFLLDDWIFSDMFCRIHGAFIEVCFTVSILSLSAVAVERYLSICNIDHGRKSVTWCIKVCVVIWLVSFLVCAPLLYGYSSTTEHNTIVTTATKHTNTTTTTTSTTTTTTMTATRSSSQQYLGQSFSRMNGTMISLGPKKSKCFITYWSKSAGLLYMCAQCAIIYILPLAIMVFTHWKIASVLKLTTRPSSTTKTTTISVKSYEESSCSSTSQNANNNNNHKNNNHNNKNSCKNEINEKNNENCQNDCKERLSTLKIMKKGVFHSETSVGQQNSKTIFHGCNRYSTTISSIEKDKIARTSFRNVRIIKLLVTVTVTFFVLWSPFIVSRISTRMNNFIPEVGWAVIQLLVLLSTTTNFFISMKMSPQFHNTVTSIFGCSYKCSARTCDTPSLKREKKTQTSDSLVV